MDDSNSRNRSGSVGQSTVPQTPLSADRDSGPAPSAATSNATVLGAPIEIALQSATSGSSDSASGIAKTSFAAPASAIAKTVTEVPENIAKTVAEAPQNIVKTVTEVPRDFASKPSIAPPPLRPKPAETIPVLPVALGVGALLAGVVLMAIVFGSSKNTIVDLPTATSVAKPATNDARNPWIRVTGAAGKVLGVGDNELPGSVRGFRPVQQILAPAASFEMQQHEVTWEELDAWLEKNPKHTFPKPATGLTSTEGQKLLPAYGVPWNVALEYCRAMGGTLPTEEQWEIAARGVNMNKYPWGSAAPDWSRVQAFKGEMAGPVQVMSSAQDRTEGPPEQSIHDLAGNVQEWTFSVWRDDRPDADESWVQAQGTTVYAVRGFPLHRDAPGRTDELSVAHRDWVCATGDCSPLSSGASPSERARTPKMELWANADSTRAGALEVRRVLEAPNVVAAMTKCFSNPLSTTLTVKAAKEVFCKRPEQVPLNGSCDGQPTISGALVRITGGLTETVQKCVNYALHDLSVANASANLPEAEFSYALHVATNPRDALRHIGFRCVR